MTFWRGSTRAGGGSDPTKPGGCSPEMGGPAGQRKMLRGTARAGAGIAAGSLPMRLGKDASDHDNRNTEREHEAA
jgi:hypothetical protein